MTRRVAIVGSRRPTPRAIWMTRRLVNELSDCVVVSGGAEGIDTYAAEFARRRGLEVKEHLADWYPNGKLDRSAGYRRNKIVVEDSDTVEAVWDGTSRGTKSTIDLATKANKLGHVVTFKRPLILTARLGWRDDDVINISRKSGVACFAPSWALLGPFVAKRRSGDELTDGDWKRYRDGYIDEMRRSYMMNRRYWLRLLDRPRSVLVCYCTNPSQCHRTVLAKLLHKLGADYGGELTRSGGDGG